MSFSNQSRVAAAVTNNVEAVFGANSFTSNNDHQNNNHVQRGNNNQDATLLHNDGNEGMDDDASSDHSDDDKNKASVSCRRGGSGRTKTTTTTSLLKKKQKWEESFKLLLQHKKRHGHAYVPVKDPQLGQWVSAMRQSYSRQRRGLPTAGCCVLPQEKVERLDAIGFLWHVPRGRRGPGQREDGQEQEQQQQAVAGHQGIKKRSKLTGNRPRSRQREDSQEQQQQAVVGHQGNKKRSKLTGNHKAKSSHHRHQKQSASQSQTPRTSVLVVHRGKQKLSSKQRAAYSRNEIAQDRAVGIGNAGDYPLLPQRQEGRAVNADDDDQLEKEEEEEENIQTSNDNSATSTTTTTTMHVTTNGPEFPSKSSAKRRTWLESCEALSEYKDRNGHVCVPQSYPQLGPWVSAQRVARKQGRLSRERVNSLDQLGFAWILRRPRRGPRVPNEQLKDAEGTPQNEGGGHELEQETRRSSAPEPSEEKGIALQELEAGHQLNIGESNKTSNDSNASSEHCAAAVTDAAGTPQQETDTSILDGIWLDYQILQKKEAQENPTTGGESLAASTSTESIEGNAGAAPAAAAMNMQNSEAIPHDKDDNIPMGEEKKSSDPLVQQMGAAAKHPEGGESPSTESVEDNAGAAPSADNDSSSVSLDKQNSPSPVQEEQVQNQLEKDESNSTESSAGNAGSMLRTAVMDVQNSQVVLQAIGNSSSLDEQNSGELHSTDQHEKGTTGETPSVVAIGATATTHEEHEDEMMASAGIDSVAPGYLKPPPNKRQRTNPAAFDATNDVSFHKMYTAASRANNATRHVSVSSCHRQHCQQSETELDEEPKTRSQPKDDESQDKSPGDEESHRANHQNRRKRKQDGSLEEPAAPLTDKQKIMLFVRMLRLPNHSDKTAEAMGLLSSMVLGGPDLDENRTVAFHCGAHALVVQAMELYQDCPDIQHHGCCILAGITSLLDTKEVIMEMDGLQACLAALERCPNHLPLLAAACNLIVNLLQYPKICKTVIEKGGLTAMIKVMKSQKQFMEVQHSGCNALLHLVSLDETSSWAEAVVDAGGIDAVIQAMESHLDDAELQKNGCMLLTTLTKSQEDYRKRIFQAKGLAVIANILWVHQSNEIVVTEAREANKAIIGA